MTVVNSTIAGIDSDEFGGGLVVRATATAAVTNTTIAGNVGESQSFAGLVVQDGGALRLENSLVVGNSIVDASFGDAGVASDVIGAVDSNGHNLFGQPTVAGAAPGDVTGVTARQVFAVLDPDGKPVLSDNGGATATLALLDSAANPAIDAADAAVAPTSDQRGAARIGAPDIGSVEADPFSPDVAAPA